MRARRRGLSRWGRAALLCGAWGAAWAAEPAAEAPPIRLFYNERYPYEYSEGGQIRGRVAEPIAAAFRAAGIAFAWNEAPMSRQLQIVQRGEGLDCMAGRYKTAEREAWARFSRPVYQDRPPVLVVRRSEADRVAQRGSLKQALLATDHLLLVKKDYSYGALLDGWLAQRGSVRLKVSMDENVNQLRQVQLRMADSALMSEEEAEALLEQRLAFRSALSLLRFPDAPPGELRYIACSLLVPDSLMHRLNAAIRFKSVTPLP